MQHPVNMAHLEALVCIPCCAWDRTMPGASWLLAKGMLVRVCLHVVLILVTCSLPQFRVLCSVCAGRWQGWWITTGGTVLFVRYSCTSVGVTHHAITDGLCGLLLSLLMDGQ